MSMVITSTIKSLLSIKIKTRYDSYSDQVSRIIVAKVFLVASVIVGIDWFRNNLACIPPPDDGKNLLPEKYIESACWIRGFFIFPELANHMSISGYYGIPSDLENNGVYSISGVDNVCQMKDKKTICRGMDKYYFVQYQWMPFYIATLATMFYFPYIIFRIVNTDVISLRLNMKDEKVTCDQIVQIYFNHDINSRSKLRMRVIFNFIIKILYVVINVSAFFLTDFILNSKFQSYGIDWIKWTNQNSSMSHDFYNRWEPTPGNRMLPTYGICELMNSRKSRTVSFTDKVTVVCGIPTNVLYQYVFLVLWFALVFSMCVTSIGVFVYLWSHLRVVLYVSKEKSFKCIYKFLTFRECEYLEFIRRRDLVMYGVIINKLRELNALPLPKVRYKKDANAAPMIPNGSTHPHPLRHLDSVELTITKHSK